MFQIGDMVREKKAVGPNKIIYYGIVTYVEAEDNPYDLSLIKVEWLNWDNLIKPTKTTQHVARLIWIKVNE